MIRRRNDSVFKDEKFIFIRKAEVDRAAIYRQSERAQVFSNVFRTFSSECVCALVRAKKKQHEKRRQTMGDVVEFGSVS